MMTFQLDTTGFVDGPCMTSAGRRFWSDLTPFTRGYIEALFVSAWAEPKFRSDWLLRDVVKGVPEEEWRTERPAYSDLAPETLARIIADCERYLGQTSITPDRATREDGRDFFMLRQSAPDYFNGPAMSQTIEGEPVASAYYFPPLTVQLGDDGKVRFA